MEITPKEQAKELIEKTREEVGNISYELIRSTSDEGVFAFFQT